MKASSKAIDLIKENLPVWKKEIFEDDSHVWK
jgi:molybdopterin synthase catalytic subunit